MTEAIVVPLGGDLPWVGVPIPGGTVPVRMAVLRDEPITRARTVLVRFPAGWSREEAGHYLADESFVVLDGTLEMSNETYGPGSLVDVPSGAQRFGTRAPQEVLAFAHFSGPARWVGGGGREGLIERRALELVAAPEPGARAAVDAEWLNLDTRAWVWIPAGVGAPAMSGLWFRRTFAPAAPKEQP